MTTTVTAKSLISDGQSIMEALDGIGLLNTCHHDETCGDWQSRGYVSQDCAKYGGNATTEKIAERILWRDKQRKTGPIYQGGWGAIDVIEHWDKRHSREEAVKLLESVQVR